MGKRIRSTKRQHEELLGCAPGVGFLVYNRGDGSTVEWEFLIHPKTGQLVYVTNGQPCEFPVYRDDH